MNYRSQHCIINNTDLLTNIMEMPNFLCRIKVFYNLLLDFSAFDSSPQYSAASPCPNPPSSPKEYFPKTQPCSLYLAPQKYSHVDISVL